MNYRAQAYQQSHLMTASRGDVLLALYDGALRFVAKARQAIEQKDFAAKAEAVSRATAIVEELSAVLDHKKAPALAGHLASLYGYFLRQIQRASSELKGEYLTEVEGHLQGLRGTWQQAVQKARQEGLRV
jgi:flagellar protein FliS